MSTVFTFPGRAGDALLQFPVAYQWSKVTGKTFECWLDPNTCKPLETLFASQPCVSKVEFKNGVENWNCGGQPFHFDLPTSAFVGHDVHHLGFRGFPARQITLETLENAKLSVGIDKEALAKEPCFHLDAAADGRKRLLLHGQTVFKHTRSTPGFWIFLSSIAGELPELFQEILWIGDARDREIGRRTHGWGELDDGGAFIETARAMAVSDCVIACGSSMAALASVMKVPCIRVHDAIGDNPRVVWDGLGENQLNRTEVELRDLWPAWRDKWIKASVGA